VLGVEEEPCSPGRETYLIGLTDGGSEIRASVEAFDALAVLEPQDAASLMALLGASGTDPSARAR
jgi:hypothetical protein